MHHGVLSRNFWDQALMICLLCFLQFIILLLTNLLSGPGMLLQLIIGYFASFMYLTRILPLKIAVYCQSMGFMVSPPFSFWILQFGCGTMDHGLWNLLLHSILMSQVSNTDIHVEIQLVFRTSWSYLFAHEMTMPCFSIIGITKFISSFMIRKSNIWCLCHSLVIGVVNTTSSNWSASTDQKHSYCWEFKQDLSMRSLKLCMCVGNAMFILIGKFRN